MNKIYRENGKYYCLTESGNTIPCQRWYEKPKDAWHIKLPAGNETGRTYIRESLLDENGNFKFETKTTGPRVLGDWKSRLTDDERKELAYHESEIERLKQVGLNRKPETKEEKLTNEIEKLRAQLIAMGIDPYKI